MSYIDRRPPGPQFIWRINSGPNPEDLDLEADGTVRIVRNLVALARGDAA